VILDSSALVAIALDEPERQALLAKIDSAESVAIAGPTLVEAGIVLAARTGQQADQLLTELMEAADAIVIDFGAGHWEAALEAWWKYGKGRHRAALNLGDCIAYATAVIAEDSLLALGDDFRQTDVELA
jgi:ribonuclease VapC